MKCVGEGGAVFSFAHSKAINNHKKDSRRDRFEIRIARRSVAHWGGGRGY
jgi:hypothetical protein